MVEFLTMVEPVGDLYCLTIVLFNIPFHDQLDLLSSVLGKLGLMHLLKVSSQISLCLLIRDNTYCLN